MNAMYKKSSKLTLAALLTLILTLAVFTPSTAFALTPITPNYGSFYGTIVEIRPDMQNDGSERWDRLTVALKDESGQLTAFVVNEYTYLPENTKLEVGAPMVGIYDLNAPAPMIYPPQYNALVLASSDGHGIKVERFGENMLSYDGDLALLSGDYPVFWYNGIAFDGDLTGKLLAVFHTFTMTSFPAQTTPDYIVVLNDQYAQRGGGDLVLNETCWEENAIIVNGEPVATSMLSYFNEQGTLMVPLKEIAEALEFTYLWEDDTQTAYLGRAISLTVGVDSYIVGRMMPIELGEAPELTDGEVFVPLSFFRNVLGLNNAYMLEGQIVIDDGEKME